jgi:subtilisin-like proprotein convertase family protein
MTRRTICVLAASLTFAWAVRCEGDTFGHSRTFVPSLVIPDNGYDGTLNSMAAATLNVSHGGTIDGVVATMGVNHTYLGDLVIKIESPSGTLITLMEGLSDSSNLHAAFPLSFVEQLAPPVATMGSTISSFEDVCADDGICSFLPTESLSAFHAEPAIGNWTFYFGDTEPSDAGSVVTVGLGLTVTIIEPLLGDYNQNEVVDAADYTVWRDALTAGSTTLTNDPTLGTVDESDFEYWRAHFGETLGSGSGASTAAAVPEPATLTMLLMASLAMLSCRRLPVS